MTKAHKRALRLARAQDRDRRKLWWDTCAALTRSRGRGTVRIARHALRSMTSLQLALLCIALTPWGDNT